MLSRRRLMAIAAATVTARGSSGAEPVAADGDVDPEAFAIQGIDVSHWQRSVDFKAVAAAGITFCFCKATEGLDFTDPRFADNWPAMREAGLIRGAYHFGRPGADAATQAERFHDTVRPEGGDLPLVLDLEQTDGATPDEVRRWTETFVERLRSLQSAAPIIYAGLFFWRDKAGDGDALGCPLWLAAYVKTPSRYVPRAWERWSFWQYTSKGSVAGVRGRVDRDAWYGDRASFDAIRLG